MLEYEKRQPSKPLRQTYAQTLGSYTTFMVAVQWSRNGVMSKGLVCLSYVKNQLELHENNMIRIILIIIHVVLVV